MKVGDLVVRKMRGLPDWKLKPAVEQFERLGHGVVLSKHMDGNPVHSCILVYHPKTGEINDIAESLMEVISESR